MDLRPRRVVRSELLFAGKVLRIGAKLYMVARHPDHVELTTEAGEVYVVDRGRCSCQAWYWRGRREACRHEAAVEKHGLLAANLAREGQVVAGGLARA